MSEQTEAAPAKAAAPTGPTITRKPNMSRKTLRAIHRKKKALKLKADREYAKAFFEARSKRSTDKKSAFRKKKKGKK